MPRKTPPAEVDLTTRFWLRTSYVDPRSDDCMLWMGRCLPSGYGQVTDQHGNVHYAHRLAYRLTTGPIPDGWVVRHICHTPRCVRPSHLIVGSYSDNAKDMVEAGRTQVIDPPCPDLVAAIRYLYASKRFSQGDVARMVFGSGSAQPIVARIVSGQTYTDAPGPITKRGRGKRPAKRKQP